MVPTLLHTGVRSGECAGLQWNDVDFNGKFISVRRTIVTSGKPDPAAEQSKKVSYRIEKTKTERVRRNRYVGRTSGDARAASSGILGKHGGLRDKQAMGDWGFAGVIGLESIPEFWSNKVHEFWSPKYWI